jgi:hypothetical protein
LASEEPTNHPEVRQLFFECPIEPQRPQRVATRPCRPPTGRTPAPQGRRRQAPQDRRRPTFFWGWAGIRTSRLWSLKLVLDALRVHAAQHKTRPSQAEHVAGRAGTAEARGASASQLLGNPSNIKLKKNLAMDGRTMISLTPPRFGSRPVLLANPHL